ncbi:glycosyltransferase family 2 protein [Agromyces sp. ISL-38]|uniref:glycosyltransferase family 2 protein n=1 Tax=Agromyces sp. ISL-38 TaxID=2819107 RepID=UPI001BEAB52A|nr:glycosyltransferase family 2 protein [Agromyces sp. ISL-38]MBT2500509.1 glycosyltransferase family 2 protein [Agromyces sp. ISL-38]
MGTVSVIVPSYNDAGFLAACLDALARQTRPADEVIVVDNGSTDATADVARAAGARLVHEPLRGIWPATAAGFDAASGDLLARLDADSVPAPDWIAEIERRMAAADRPTAVTDSGRFYGGTALVRWIARTIYLGGYFTVMGALLGHPPLFGSNYAIRADAWAELRGVVHRDRADVHDDLDLSWWLQPGMTVVRERRLIVGVSARPFDTVAELSRRLRMAFHTIAVEWREWPPLERRADRRRGHRRDAGDGPTITPDAAAGLGSDTDAVADETEHPLSA